MLTDYNIYMYWFFSIVLSVVFYFLSWYLYKPEELTECEVLMKEQEALENGKETKL